MLLSIAVGRYTLELAHMISHDGIPDHTISGHSHHGHDHHHHGHDHHSKSHSHDTAETEQIASNLNMQPYSNNRMMNSDGSSEHICLAQDFVLCSCVYVLKYRKTWYQKVFWYYLYTNSLVDPPEFV